MTRVLFVSSHAELGGSERYLFDLLTHLDADVVDKVISLAEGPSVGRLRDAGIEVEVIPTTGSGLSILRASRVLREAAKASAATVVHANGVKAALVCALARLRLPVVWAKHDFSWDGRIARLVAGRSSLIVGVSGAVLGPLSGDKTRVVMPGIPAVEVDLDGGRKQLEEMVGSEAPVVALVGRVHPVKGHAELIEAGVAIKEKSPDVRFLFIGARDPQQEAYAQEMEELAQSRLGTAAVWTGYRADILNVLAACSAIAVVTGSDKRAPRPEGFGYVAVEAMAVGTPVVGYSNGATPEVLGECGFLVQPGNRQGLAEAVVRAIQDKSYSRSVVTCGRVRASETFSINRFVTDMQAIYDGVSS